MDKQHNHHLWKQKRIVTDKELLQQGRARQKSTALKQISGLRIDSEKVPVISPARISSALHHHYNSLWKCDDENGDECKSKCDWY